MNFRSHLMLSLQLLDSLSVCKAAFLFGSVEPDIAVLTYLKGSIHGRRLHGHDYRNMKPRICHILSRIPLQKPFGIIQSYRLGKLLHYIADSFTLPHNETFIGTIKEHMLYEDLLEETLRACLAGLQDEVAVICPGSIAGYIFQAHDEYIAAPQSADADASYIIAVSSAVACALAGKEATCSIVPAVQLS